MTVIIIIFFIAIISLLGMLMFRAWEIKTSQIEKSLLEREIFPKIYFRHVEKIMLYSTKQGILWVVLVVVKYWFILHVKTKKWTGKNLPKIYKFFRIKTKDIGQQKSSFVSRAIFESKIKIKHIREKVRKEHEEIEEDKEEKF